MRGPAPIPGAAPQPPRHPSSMPATGPMRSGGLPMWTVYDSPTDFPGWAIARQWMIHGAVARATNVVIVAPTLELLRRRMPAGLIAIPRHASDDPVIVETWL